MLRQRVLVSIILLPIGLTVIYFGGIVFTLFIALLLGVAAWEFSKLFKIGGYQPSEILTILGAVALILGRGFSGFESADWILGIFILASMSYHLVAYERGRDQAGTDFALTLAGALYLGWIGAYLLSLRDLPNGMWWFMIALPAVWAADTGAYFYGSRFGKHKLAPRLSPKKSWEGYFAGILTGPLIGVAFAALGMSQTPPDAGITLLRGAILGLVLAAVTPLGDLGESMIKRQFGVKDSGKIFPGHGGAFDRVDTWIWAAIISHSIITWFFL
jgi:phosphatidate cytidylyltransferase